MVTRAMSAMTMSTGTTGTARVRSRRAVRGRGRVAATRADGEADEAAALRQCCHTVDEILDCEGDTVPLPLVDAEVMALVVGLCEQQLRARKQARRDASGR